MALPPAQKKRRTRTYRKQSANTITYYHAQSHTLEEVHELFRLIDDESNRLPAELKGSIQKYLLQCLFDKLERLNQYCVETDEYFEQNDGAQKTPQQEDTIEVRTQFVGEVED